jgi:polyisoprenoid-binding protein YceI
VLNAADVQAVKIHFAMPTALGALLLLGLPLAAAADAYNVDGMHSMPSFTFKHLDLSSFRGRFEKITGTIEFDPVQHSGSADIAIDIDSVSTGVPMLDQFLKSAKFFDSARFPTATFKSNSFKFSGEQLVSVSGDLSLHGITKPVVVEIVYLSCREHPLLNIPSCGADAIVIDAFIGNDSDEVKVDIPVEALKASRP